MNLQLTNFRCWENKSLSLPENGLCLLSGKSGKGKSTILNSLVYAITGKGKNITTFQKKSTSVEFLVDHLKITRSRGPNRLVVQDQTTGKIYEDDQAQGVIDQIFGSEFCNVSYIDQDNHNSFVYLSPHEKMTFLEQLLLHQYKIDDMKDKVKDAINKAKNDYTSTEARLSTLKEMMQKMTLFSLPSLVIDKVCIHTNNSKKVMEKVTSNLEVCEKNVKSLTTKIKKNEQAMMMAMKHSEKRKTIEHMVNDIESQLSAFHIVEDELSLLEEKKKIYLSNRDLYHFKQLKETYEQHLSKNNLEREKYIEMIAGIPSMISIQKSIQAIEKANDIMDRLSVLDEKIEELSNKDEENNENSLSSLLSNKQMEWTQIKNHIQHAKTCYHCPSCHKTLKFYKERLLLDEMDENLANNVDELNEQSERLSKEIKKIQADLDEIKKKHLHFEKLKQEYNTLYDTLEKLFVLPTGRVIDQEDMDTVLKEYNEYLEKHTQSKRGIERIDDDRLFFKIKQEYDDFKKKHPSLSLENVDCNITTVCNMTETEYENLNEKIAKEKEKKARRDELKKKGDQYKKELDVISAEEGLDINEIKNTLSVDREKVDTYTAKIEQYRNYLKQLEDWVKKESENQRYYQIENDCKTAEVNKEMYTDRISSLVRLRDHIRQAEQKSLEEFIGALNQHASIYIEEFFPDEDILVELKTIQEGKVSGKEKISLCFDVNYRGMNGDLTFLSGGEKDRVNLAFTLAFSELVDNRVLLLDECISSLDAETTNIVLEKLREKYKGKLVIVVSHQANLGFFDSVVTL